MSASPQRTTRGPEAINLSPPFRRKATASALSDGAVVVIGDAPIRLKVNSRARRVSLRLDAGRGEVIATAPTARKLHEALAFAQSRRDWIAERLEALPKTRPFVPFMVLEVNGAPLRLERAAMRAKSRFVAATAQEPARLIASGEGEAFARAVTRALKGLALETLEARTGHYAGRLGHPTPEVFVMNARMRWGSCRQASFQERARIRYNWRLILAPPFVLDYVAAHEAAHLVEANHSPAYWAVVRAIFGDHKAARAWLRAHGGALHALGA